MRLYCSLTSPYSRKVRVALIEQGIAASVEMIMTDPFAPPPELLAANPMSKIPTLVTDRGEALPDSNLILEYLQARHGGFAPLPRGSRRWATLRLQRIAEGIIDAAVATVYERRRPEGIVYIPFLDRQALAIQRAIAVLEAECGALSLTGVGVLEITAGVALSYLDFRLPYLEWRQSAASLAAWHAQFAQRPSMVQTAPPT
ncbi:glutathione S-transferase family protein [Sinimarinibacterium thermocellulolyticum]|uniref:Glutathione S-transferase family protein n=1 Tax=Sinimarinibacterium thermocellulolyticum TaxID=3170016 RepID=A0ABV2AB09_9GAMM